MGSLDSCSRSPMMRRRTSLSRTLTREEVDGEDEDEEEEEILDEVGSPGSPASAVMSTPSVAEEDWVCANPELLPPPGPYIRHLNFTNFRTIGSGRTQGEAVRGRYVTAGRLEGVIKV